MIKFVGYLLFLSSFSVHGLVPVEGILMGEAPSDIQTDPLLTVFSDIYDKSQFGENKKIKLYQSTYASGRGLTESCSYLEAPKYSAPWQETQARRSMVATLQYIGLDTAIKGIGAYAKKLDISEENFKTLTSNLVKNYCSQNISVLSLKTIEHSLKYYYENPNMELIPSVASSPFATLTLKRSSETEEARSREFDHVINSFRAFCSWGGEVEDYRLMTHYLRNQFIMAFVIKNMIGVQDKIHNGVEKVFTEKSDATIQVVCTDLICRKEDKDKFDHKFPLSIGSTGLETDLSKLYCHHFRFQDSPQNTLSEVRAWNKEMELEDPILETSNFISLMTGVPDFFSGVESYNEVPLLVRSSVDERWNKWSRDILELFSKDLLYEESFKIKVEPRRDRFELASEGIKLNFTISLGEMDRLMQDHDKLGMSFDLKLSKNYLRTLRTKWKTLDDEVDLDGKKQLNKDIAEYLDLQIRDKERYFKQKMWNKEFSKLIAGELLEQAINYPASFFASYEDKVIRVPVKFSYGIFAISYLSYRAESARSRSKLNLKLQKL